MVTDAILAFFSGLIAILPTLFPAWSQTADSPSIAAFRNLIWNVNGYAPITEIGAMMALYSAVWGAMQALKWILKLFGMMRGSG